MNSYRDICFLFTKANADTDGRVINQVFEKYAKENNNFCLVDSLGMKRYFNALKNALFVIGNSSSGLIEAPSFGIPTINIGDRQRGRIAGETVLNCEPERQSICNAIDKALNESFRNGIKNASNLYGDGHTSEKIVDVVKTFFVHDKIEIKKKFYDLNFEV